MKHARSLEVETWLARSRGAQNAKPTLSLLHLPQTTVLLRYFSDTKHKLQKPQKPHQCQLSSPVLRQRQHGVHFTRSLILLPLTRWQPFLLTHNFVDTKLVRAALSSFYGIGPLVASRIMARHHIHETAKIGSLANQKLLDITAELTTMKIENDKRREIRDNIALLRDMGTYRGRRHAMGLPVRGQNTKSGQVSLFPAAFQRLDKTRH
jgi:small subunit ribosomal protein S13